MKQRETLYLIDGTALLYRAYFAFIRNPLINSKGQNTGAIFGVISSFMHFNSKHLPRHILISFDRKAPTFRHEISEAYKANRPPMPDDLVSQIEPVKEFFSRIGLPEIGMDGYEADDVLGTLARHFAPQYDILIVSGDKDYSQLVDDQIKLYDPMKDVIIDANAVRDKFGVLPQQFIDYLALVGDSSDNIPGVKGIGAKYAADLLQKYDSLDGIYQNLDSISGKLKDKLSIDKDNAYLSYELATINCTSPIPLPNPEAFVFDPLQMMEAIPLLEEYEVLSLKRSIESYCKSQKDKQIATTPEPIIEPENELQQADIFATEEVKPLPIVETLPFEAITATSENLPELWDALARAETVSIDCETDNIDPMLANLVGMSLCTSENRAWYLPLAHQMSENLAWEELKPLLAKALSSKLLLGHNIKYDLIVFERHGLILEQDIFDTMLAAYLLDPGTNQYSLDACSHRELQHRAIPISALIGSGKNQITFDLTDLKEATRYAAEDAWMVLKLYPIYLKRLQDSKLLSLYQSLELPLIPVLMRMEMHGVLVDEPALAELAKLINQELFILTEKIYAIAGYQFNINSTQQLAKLLFEDLQIKALKKTKTGVSTDNSVLEELADEHEIASLLINYRQMSKLLSTYVNTLPKLINPHSGRIHTSFNQTIASTGRLSSSNPNLQNIPIRTEIGRQIRKAFVAPHQDWQILSADYSQIELRLLALMSEDEVLLSAFAKGVDIHKQTMAFIKGIAPEDVSPEDRRAAKAINFGILYGMGAQKLSRELGITLAAAKQIIADYFARFPTIRNFLDRCVLLARQNHYCETIFGRRLFLPNINSNSPKLKSEAERVAVNMPIQGSAADLIKYAMLDIHKQCKNEKRIKMILQVHDELVFEIHKDFLPEAKSLICNAMQNALPQRYRPLIELKTEVGVGANWLSAH